MEKNKLIDLLLINYTGKTNSWKSKNLKKFLFDNQTIENELIKNTNFCPLHTPWQIRFNFLINNIVTYPICKNCMENPVSINIQQNKLRDYCGVKCASTSPEVRKKVKESFEKKYGVEHPMKSSIQIKNFQKNVF